MLDHLKVQIKRVIFDKSEIRTHKACVRYLNNLTSYLTSMYAMPDQLSSFLTRYSLYVQILNVCFFLKMNEWLMFVMCDFDFLPYK